MTINVLISVTDNSQCMSLSQVPNVYLNPQLLQRSKSIHVAIKQHSPLE